MARRKLNGVAGTRPAPVPPAEAGTLNDAVPVPAPPAAQAGGGAVIVLKRPRSIGGEIVPKGTVLARLRVSPGYTTQTIDKALLTGDAEIRAE